VRYHEDGITVSYSGECIGLIVEGTELRRGQVLLNDTNAVVGDSILARIFWLSNDSYIAGSPLTWKLATQSVVCTIDKIFRRFDPATLQVVETDAERINNSEIAEVRIRFEAPVVADKFSDIPEMGRFVLEVEGYPVAGGIVV
jgi:elongation factor 1-alpha